MELKFAGFMYCFATLNKNSRHHAQSTMGAPMREAHRFRRRRSGNELRDIRRRRFDQPRQRGVADQTRRRNPAFPGDLAIRASCRRRQRRDPASRAGNFHAPQWPAKRLFACGVCSGSPKSCSTACREKNATPLCKTCPASTRASPGAAATHPARSRSVLKPRRQLSHWPQGGHSSPSAASKLVSRHFVVVK